MAIRCYLDILDTRKPRLKFRTPARDQARAPGRRVSAPSDQDPPRNTRRPQSPAQQSSVHSITFPSMSDRPAPFEP